MVLVRLPTGVKLVSVRGVGSLISTKRTFAAEAKPKKIAVITGASRLVKNATIWEISCFEEAMLSLVSRECVMSYL